MKQRIMRNGNLPSFPCLAGSFLGRRTGSSHCGFTLYELLILLLILACLAAFALPSFGRAIHRWRLQAATRQVYRSFHKAKTFAALHNVICTLAFDQRKAGATCGYTLFSDTNANLRHDGGEEMIERVRWDDLRYVQVARTPDGLERLTFNRNDDGCPAVGFRPNGLPLCSTGGLGMGSLHLENRFGARFALVLSSAGRLRVLEELQGK